jgi:hypothetical protein
MLQIISILIILFSIYMECLGQQCPKNPENVIIFIDACPTKEANYITDIGEGPCTETHADHVIKTYKTSGGKHKVWLFTTMRKEKPLNPFIKALSAALSCGVKIISTSMSSHLGEDSFNQVENDLINQFTRHGGRYYAAAGNYSKNLMLYPVYPAAYESVNPVGAKNCMNEKPDNYSIASYSNYGQKVKYWACGKNSFDENSQGTSFATPRLVAKKEG